MKDSIEIIIESIVKEAENFFKNDMLFDVVETKDIQNNILYNHNAFIDLDGSTKFRVLMSIDDKLLQALFDRFFEDEVNESEKDELVDALPDEVINTIVGLSIRNFPLKHEYLELSPPFKLDEEKINKILNENIFKSLEICTKQGSFICLVTVEE